MATFAILAMSLCEMEDSCRVRVVGRRYLLDSGSTHIIADFEIGSPHIFGVHISCGGICWDKLSLFFKLLKTLPFVDILVEI